jgi:hypothetical protein
MSFVINAAHFHPMRGHVEHGASVLFSDGRALTVKSVTGGWGLFDDKGRQVGETADGAYTLTTQIVKLEAGEPQ